jgi:hypothetical protein
MQTALNRTFICSVVFLDMVEYSRKPVAEQIFFKERLNSLLTQALANIAPNDRIILDTGDGAALSFLGDPEDALYVSLSLREALEGPQPSGPELKMRLGINLGPVRLVKDINARPDRGFALLLRGGVLPVRGLRAAFSLRRLAHR